MVTVVVGGEPRDPEPGDPGDPGDPGFNEAEEGGLDMLVLVDPEKESLKLGLCLPVKVDFPKISLSSVSFTGVRRSKQKNCSHPIIDPFIKTLQFTKNTEEGFFYQDLEHI